ncbi:MAG: hypothetical protein KAS53_00840 [Candidatus Cloacimonetes bacterium]|nr:hypothetical protein [Candidatus Cloacimonadota bacterium]
MAHLKSFRAGWENEHVAKYIISKFSFISSPNTIGDDLGVDFFCTIFDVQMKNKKKYLFPTKNSFAIQIKSNRSDINFTKKINYLYLLHFPFFVGVVSQKKKKLTFYSNIYFDKEITIKWPKEKLLLKLSDEKRINKPYYYNENKKARILTLQKCAQITFTDDDESIIESVELIKKNCSTMQKNILNRLTEHYVFFNPNTPTQADVVTGKDSYNGIRKHFFNRFGELLSNLEWFLKSNPENQKARHELDYFKEFYNKTIKLWDSLGMIKRK